MTTARAALIGLCAAAAAIATLELPVRRRQADLELRLREQDQRLAALLPIRAKVEDYQRRKARLEQQVSWIEKERDATCPLPFPTLDPEGIPGARFDELALDRSTLVALGQADSEASLEGLATSIRALPWVREVEAGAGAAKGAPFGLFARVAIPPCRTDPGAGADAGGPR